MTPKQLSWFIIWILALAGCHQGASEKESSVSRRLAQGRPAASPTTENNSSSALEIDDQPPIAWVNNHPISQERFNKLLVQSHGLFVLEQLVVLRIVQEQATTQGISITQLDIQEEYDRSLRELAGPVTQDNDPLVLITVGRQMLQQFLSEKNISVDEYLLGIERNVYLRKMVGEVQVSDEEIQSEFERRYGRKAVVRHMALAEISLASEARRQLEEGGNFGELAELYSSNRSSAVLGGLLPPFSRMDEQVPLLMRQIVFELKPGEVSNVTKIDEEYHLFKVESYLEPNSSAVTPALKAECMSRVRDHKTREAMQALQQQLRRTADIRIEDSMLRSLYKQESVRPP